MDSTYNLQIIGIIHGLWVVYCIMGRIMSIIHGLLMYCIVGSIIVYNLQIIPIIHGLYESDHNSHDHEVLALLQV